MLLIRNQVPVAPPQFLGLVSHPFVDQALVNAFRGAVAGEAVAEHVPAFQNFPLAAVHRPAEMMGGELGGQCNVRF